MNLFIVVCLVLCWTKVMSQEATGLIERVSKEVVAEDMVNILSTIFGNAKYWNFTNINETMFEDTSSNKGLMISEIRATVMEFDQTLGRYKLKTIEDSWVHIDAKDVLSYLFTFKWEASSSGVHIAFGEGSALFRAHDLEASYNPAKLTSKINMTWDVTLKDFNGIGLFNDGIKAWVQNKLEKNLKPQLVEGINYNRKFIHEYMHFHTKQLRKTLSTNKTLDYNATVLKIAEDNNHLIYYYSVSLALDDKIISKLTLGIEIPAGETIHNLSYYVAPQYIPLTIDAYGHAKKFDEYIDLKSLGFTGTVKDLFEVLPELYSIYNEKDELKLYCEYGHKGVQHDLPDQKVIIPAECRFLASKNTLLAAKVAFNMNYEPIIFKSQLASKIENITITECTSQAETMTSVVFLADLFSRVGLKKFKKDVSQMPMILYPPRKTSKKFQSSIREKIFVIDYDF